MISIARASGARTALTLRTFAGEFTGGHGGKRDVMSEALGKIQSRLEADVLDYIRDRFLGDVP